jgi:hypothetical protein
MVEVPLAEGPPPDSTAGGIFDKVSYGPSVCRSRTPAEPRSSEHARRQDNLGDGAEPKAEA